MVWGLTNKQFWSEMIYIYSSVTQAVISRDKQLANLCAVYIADISRLTSSWFSLNFVSKHFSSAIYFVVFKLMWSVWSNALKSVYTSGSFHLSDHRIITRLICFHKEGFHCLCRYLFSLKFTVFLSVSLFKDVVKWFHALLSHYSRWYP